MNFNGVSLNPVDHVKYSTGLAAEESYEHTFEESVLGYSKELDLRNIQNRNIFATILDQCYGKNLFQCNDDTLAWLAAKEYKRKM